MNDPVAERNEPLANCARFAQRATTYFEKLFDAGTHVIDPTVQCEIAFPQSSRGGVYAGIGARYE